MHVSSTCTAYRFVKVWCAFVLGFVKSYSWLSLQFDSLSVCLLVVALHIVVERVDP